MTCYEEVPRLSFSRRFVLWILAIGVTGALIVVILTVFALRNDVVRFLLPR